MKYIFPEDNVVKEEPKETVEVELTEAESQDLFTREEILKMIREAMKGENNV